MSSNKRLPTENIFNMWVDQYGYLSKDETENLKTTYSFFRSDECTTADQLNSFILNLTGGNEPARRKLSGILKEFLNLINESQTIKSKYHGHQF